MQGRLRLRAWLQSGLVVLALVFALSTQFLFQFHLYQLWPLADILRGWLDYFLDLLLVGACIWTALNATASLRLRSTLARHLVILVSMALGALTGEVLFMLRVPPAPDLSAVAVLLGKVVRWFVVGGLAYAIYTYLRRSADAAAQAHETELQRVQIERQTAEARLQALRAQIEPHFLFNTLANLHRLYETDRVRGQRMLADFIAYLRAALPRMQGDQTTLGQEVELTRAYLNVLQVRMGQRLCFRLNLPQELGRLPFPPLALSTLTENAIKHGLNPLPEGGSIDISARIENDLLRVQVADTGAGFKQASGTGAGLANLRARLAALYGEAAQLDIRANAPRGIRATIAVPLRSR
jgi:sensor histidine kinase YesM